MNFTKDQMSLEMKEEKREERMYEENEEEEKQSMSMSIDEPSTGLLEGGSQRDSFGFEGSEGVELVGDESLDSEFEWSLRKVLASIDVLCGQPQDVLSLW